MKRWVLSVSLVSLIFAFHAARLGGGSVPSATGQVPVTAKPMKAPMAGATDGPRIMEFAASPAVILEGGQSTFHWRVEPGPSGSPIESLEIFDGTPASPGGRIYARLLLNGEYPTGAVATGGRGRWSYTLRVVDRARKSASRTIEIVTGTLDSFLAGLSGFTLNLETVVDGARRDHIATLGFDNGSGIAAGSVMIYLYQAYSPLMLGVDVPDGYLAGHFPVSNLLPGHNEFRIGVSLRPVAPATGDLRGLSKLALLIVKEHSPGVIERILIKGLYDLVETRDGTGARYSVRLIRVG